MTTKCFAFVLCLLVGGFSAAYAQDVSNRGKDFWVAYSGHIDALTSRMALYITADQNATGKVEVNGVSVPFTVTANQVTTVQLTNGSALPNSAAYNAQVEGIGTKKGIHITADRPVAVYAHILNAARSGSTLVLPTNVLGKEYYVSSYKTVTPGATRRSQFNVVATTDNTTVEITPTKADGNGLHPANVTFSITLSKGDVYQYQSDEDLTGTHIKSVGTNGTACAPVAVFSGSTFTAMGCAAASSGDNLYQQLFPVAAWGKAYYTAPFISRAYDIFRILVQDPTEPVYVNGVALNPATLVSGRFYEINTQGNNTSRVITSDKPICVLQYLITQACDGVNSDPEMVILNPIEQTLNDITVMSARSDLTPPSTNIASHYLNIIFKTNSFGSLRIDNQPPTATPVAIPGTAYSYIQQNVTASTALNPAHRITSDSGFICIAYGYGNVESYGYNAGANVKDLYQFVSIRNQFGVVDFPATCKSTPFNFSMTFPYQPTQITWQLSTIGYADTTLINPVFDSTFVINGKTLYNYKLPNPYTVSNTGTYVIKVLATNPTSDGCGTEQEIAYDLQVYERPTASFSFANNGCVTDSVRFMDQSNGNSRPVIYWGWNFGDNVTSSLKNPGHLYTAPGTYTAGHFVITDIGCVSDTATQNVTLNQPPVSKFGVSSLQCINRTVFFSDSSITSNGTIVKWYWNFGDGSPIVTATTSSQQSHTYTQTGTYTVTLITETATGCQSAAESKMVTINSKPVADFRFGDACLPAGAMLFTNQSTLTGGAGNSLSYQWNFGDGGTATTPNPLHPYTSVGPFTVTLIAVSSAGCQDTATRTNTNVYAQPKASFTVDTPNACQDKSFAFASTSSAAASTVTEWFWDFGDGTTAKTEKPVKNYAQSGTYMVRLVVKSAIGCYSDTAVQSVKVYALPTSFFSIPSLQCETKTIIFKDGSVANEGNIVSWKWNMGLGAPDSIHLNGAPFGVVYPMAGSYRVTLVTETNYGCKSPKLDTTIAVYPQPIPGFAMSANCLIDPYSEFSDTSKIAAGTLTSWAWTFGDPGATPANPNTATVPVPRHKYAQAITYQVGLTVTSDKGCAASVTQPFTVNGSVPQSSFAVVGGSTQCSNDSVRIVNQSFADVGNIVKLEIYWDYANDPLNKTTDMAPFTGKQYATKYPEFFSPATKSYVIKLVAYSGERCLKDSTLTLTLTNTPEITFNSLAAVCGNTPVYFLAPAQVNNNVGGTGVYTGKATGSNGQFNAAAAGTGLHTVRYTHTGGNGCRNFKEQIIQVYPVPTVSAGPDRIVLEGGIDSLKGAGSGANIVFTWTPNRWLSSASVPNPVTSAQDDITYTLQVTSSDGCLVTDDVFVRVLKAPTIPNVFTPNNDGINDRWEIQYLETYPGATVEIYNRYGQVVFQSKGYSKAWDGTFNGKPVPAGTYYYIVDPKNKRKQIAGFVDIIR